MMIKNWAGKLWMAAAFAGMATASYAAEYRAGELIVKYKDGSFRSRLMMNDLYTAAGVKNVKRMRGIMQGFEQVTLQDNVKMEDAMAEFTRSGAVEYVQPNYILRIYPTQNFNAVAAAPNAAPPCIIPGIPFPPGCEDPTDPGNPGNPTPPPNGSRPALKPAPADVDPPVADPDLGKIYGMKQIGATTAWKSFRGSKEIIVADIDTGIDYNHEDLAFNIWRNPNPTQGDVVGYDFTHNDGLPFDDHSHGTHTTGTIGAVGGNGIGVSGVAQRVSIMGLKFLSKEGSGTTADAVRAIDYAISHGAKVLSNSWGGKGDDGNAALQEAVERARAKDVLFIAAAGNDGTDNDKDPSFPAAFTNDNMISVAATDEKDRMAFFSNYGVKTTHLAAPGVNIYSTVPGNKYESMSGTSMACPHVAGAAAMIWAQNPTWNYKQVKQALLSSVDPLPVLKNKVSTGGRLNLQKALRAGR